MQESEMKTLAQIKQYENQKRYRKKHPERMAAYEIKHYKENKKKIDEYQKKYREENKDNAKKYRETHKDEICNTSRKSWKKGYDELSDSYIKKILTSLSVLTAKDIPQELIELKRLEIKLKRGLKDGEKDNKND